MECFSSLELEKRRLMSDDFDPVFVCVDPYDVNPLFTSKASTMRDSPSESRAPAHYAKIKLEMEEFGDLSPFVQTRHGSVNSVDELVTPIFDKDAFDFGTNTTTTTSIFLNSNVDNTDKQEQQYQQQQQLELNEEPFVKLERELLASACSFAKRDNPNIDRRQQGNDNNNVHIINSNNNNNILINSNSNATALLFAPYGNVSNGSNNNSVGSNNNDRARLSLNVNVRDVTGTGFDLSTPSIIEEVVDLEAATNGGFKIFNLVEKEHAERSPLGLAPAALLAAPAATPPRPIVKQEPVERKRRRQRDESDDDDDDDDYLPPTPKRTSRRRVRAKNAPAVDSESESGESSRHAQQPRRSSFSSECSETSKYRELRDKNNEASRKSRLKRKLKELEMESEAEELSSRNVKLRAQVEELEKLVTNFRENLFKMMMAKK